MPCGLGHAQMAQVHVKLHLNFSLNAALALLSLGQSGTRFLTATIGADQLNKTQDQVVFFNW